MADMTKERIAHAEGLGIDVDKRWSAETLEEKISEAEAEADQPVTVRCLIPNVWTSAGKIRQHDEAKVPANEAAFLAGRKQVERV